MKKILWITTLCLSFFVGKYYQQSLDTINIVNDCPVMVYSPDTVIIPMDTHYVNTSCMFKSRGDIELFIKYVKTQSGQLDDDNWAVMKTMKNRMLDHDVTFTEYFNSRRVNNSQTIARITMGHKVNGFSFSWDNPVDVELYKRALDVYFGQIPSSIDTMITRDVRAFESHPLSWNEHRDVGIFKRKNIAYKNRHEYYRIP